MSDTSVLVAGRYRLEARIAAGGMGEVWRGTDDVLGRPVAVKMLRTEYAQHPGTLARFRAEARHASALSHPGIARVYDYGEAEAPYLVMELVDGLSLAEVLERGPLDPGRTMDVVAQAAAGLQAAHRAEQQVSWLDITVHQPGPVRGLQAGRRLCDHIHDPARIQRPSLEHLGQRRPVDQLHHQVRDPGFPVVVDLRDARMRQRAGMPGLGPEPDQGLRVLGVLGAQQLDRHRSAEHLIGAFPDLAHAAGRDPALQPVPARNHRTGIRHDSQTLPARRPAIRPLPGTGQTVQQ